MSTEELTMNDIAAVCSRPERAEKKASRKAVTRADIAFGLRSALDALITAAGGASVAFGFWTLANRQKDLGFIDAIVALAVIVGVGFAACGIASLVRAVKERRSAAK